jgi:hypothetical protein
MKTCARCKNLKDFCEFNKRGAGLGSYCKSCLLLIPQERILKKEEYEASREFKDELLKHNLSLCLDCFEIKDSCLFVKQYKKTRSYCIGCFQIRSNNFYKNNKEHRIKLIKNRYEENRKIVDKIKSAPCMDCQLKFKPHQMDFDHLSNKIKDVSKMMLGNTEKLLEEIRKCDLVCANCHRERTFQRNR